MPVNLSGKEQLQVAVKNPVAVIIACLGFGLVCVLVKNVGDASDTLNQFKAIMASMALLFICLGMWRIEDACHRAEDAKEKLQNKNN